METVCQRTAALSKTQGENNRCDDGGAVSVWKRSIRARQNATDSSRPGRCADNSAIFMITQIGIGRGDWTAHWRRLEARAASAWPSLRLVGCSADRCPPSHIGTHAEMVLNCHEIARRARPNALALSLTHLSPPQKHPPLPQIRRARITAHPWLPHPPLLHAGRLARR